MASADGVLQGPYPGIHGVVYSDFVPDDECSRNCLVNETSRITKCPPVSHYCHCFPEDTTEIERAVSKCLIDSCGKKPDSPTGQDIFRGINTYCAAKIGAPTGRVANPVDGKNSTTSKSATPTDAGPRIETDPEPSSSNKRPSRADTDRSAETDSITTGTERTITATHFATQTPTPSTTKSTLTNPSPPFRELPGATIAGIVLCIIALLILCIILCFLRDRIQIIVARLRNRRRRVSSFVGEKSKGIRGVPLISTDADCMQSPGFSTPDILSPEQGPDIAKQQAKTVNQQARTLQIPTGIAELPGSTSFAQELHSTVRIIELPSPTIFPPDEKIPYDGEPGRQASLSPFEDVCPPYPGTRD
ncbi:hypothetical protein CP533_5956 [Ophiocordyceps camponoti-saundersi (nom. inval.)]|nr:hypothetical protein CP533_5956 [Ophiocordyceps camponoti-saundersi (nom. inval.)]